MLTVVQRHGITIKFKANIALCPCQSISIDMNNLVNKLHLS